jgi:hypothetical protein
MQAFTTPGLQQQSDGWIVMWSGIDGNKTKGRLKNYLAFCLENVQSFRDFTRQIMPGYFCTIPNVTRPVAKGHLHPAVVGTIT